MQTLKDLRARVLVSRAAIAAVSFTAGIAVGAALA